MIPEQEPFRVAQRRAQPALPILFSGQRSSFISDTAQRCSQASRCTAAALVLSRSRQTHHTYPSPQHLSPGFTPTSRETRPLCVYRHDCHAFAGDAPGDAVSSRGPNDRTPLHADIWVLLPTVAHLPCQRVHGHGAELHGKARSCWTRASIYHFSTSLPSCLFRVLHSIPFCRLTRFHSFLAFSSSRSGWTASHSFDLILLVPLLLLTPVSTASS